MVHCVSFCLCDHLFDSRHLTQCHGRSAPHAVPPGGWFPLVIICLSVGFAFFFSKWLEEKIVLKKGGTGSHGCTSFPKFIIVRHSTVYWLIHPSMHGDRYRCHRHPRVGNRVDRSRGPGRR